MSRIIVKNLPKRATEERLRSVFGEKGFITECSLKYTKDGVFRRFAFVGFKTAEEAKRAVSHFHGTFIDTTKIQVEIAKDLGDVNKPRAWSKYSKDSSAYKNQQEDEIDDSEAKDKKGKSSKVDELFGDLKEDPEFQDFLEVHKSRSTKALWANDTVPGKNVEVTDKTANNSKKASKPQPTESASSGSELESEDESSVVEKKSAKVTKKGVSDFEYLMSKVTSSHLLSDEDLSGSDLDLDDSDDSSADEAQSDDDDDDDDRHEENDDIEKQEETGFNYIVKMKGLPVNIGEAQINEFFKPVKTKSIKIPRNAKGKKDMRVASVTLFTEKDMEQAMRRNKNFIGPNKIFLHKTKEKIEEPCSSKPRPWEMKTGEDEEVEGIEESGRLFVRNLAYCCQEEDLEKLFSKYGPLTEIHLPLDTFTKKIKGFAFVTYMIPEHAVKAYTELDGSVFQGRMLHILPGKQKKETELEITDSMSHKQKKELKLKKEASSSHNWNTLFLGANAVADVMADKYGTSKDQILSMDSRQSLGVRLALGETQIVAETRDFLLEHDVALDAFSQAASERSKSVILVKNLPAGTSGEELEKLFSRFGTLGRLVLPPSGVTAIVEFAESSEAKNAFRNLAYTKFKYIPLYLEWAPVGVFSTPATKHSRTESVNKEPTQSSDGPSGSDAISGKEETMEVDKGGEEGEEPAPEPGSSLFVKNLNFDTTDDALTQHFEKCGKVQKVSIAKKKDMKNPGHFLSMGYGFVEYVKKESADKALKRLQHSMLDDHQLDIKLSHRATMQKKTSNSSRKKQDPDKKQTTSKILVRNVPFEAKPAEIRELFATFGELKFVRLPKKLSGSGTHRGFAFVDFLTKQDAKRAFGALCHSTHLYGRRLVLEWAESEESVDELRRKTAEHYHDGPRQKKLKKSTLTEELNSITKFD